ncbi:MAG: DNA phosphorothioation system sulfurtransferase DndC [Bacilli bacterium]
MNNLNFDIFENVKSEMKLVYLHDNRPWMIGFSGGKDSTLLCYLVFEMLKSLKPNQLHKIVYIVSSDTMVENPIVRDYMHTVSEKIGIAGEAFKIVSKIIYPKLENTFWSKVIGLGYPTPESPGFRWCTDRLKIEPMNRFTRETIEKNGEIVILLGVRKAESISRGNSITNREIEGKLLIPHNDIENAYIYNPLTEIPNEIVWDYLLSGSAKTPWGESTKYLFSLYQGENLGEEKSVIGEIDKEKIPVTGNSRFGCWICTMVKEDKSLKNFIDNGEKWLIPLRDYRNWLLELRKTPEARENKRRNGSVYLMGNGEIGKGPFTMETRKLMLRRLLQLEVNTGLSLISTDELKIIDRIWENEGDLTRRELVNTYFDVKKVKLSWDGYKIPIFENDIINEIKILCKKNKIEFELISKLIVEIEKNKNYTKTSLTNIAFDKIINQGWLHFNNIKEGFDEYEN